MAGSRASKSVDEDIGGERLRRGEEKCGILNKGA